MARHWKLVTSNHSMKSAVITVLFALLVAGRMSSAQTLTRIAEVTSLDPDGAVKNPRAVKLHGVVTFINAEKTLVTIDDGEHGIGISLPDKLTAPNLGDEIEAEGRTMQVILGGVKHPRVLASSLRVLRTGTLPEPKKLTLPELNSFKHFEQWVSVEGHVLRWRYLPSTQTLTIAIAGQTTWTTMVVPGTTRPPFADQLMGARLRITGINAGINTHGPEGALLVPSLKQIEVLKPGWKSAFDAPLVSMKDLKTDTLAPESRVKVRGIVVGFRRGYAQVFVRGADGAQLNRLQSPWFPRASADEEVVDAGPWPALQQGDAIEMVGSTDIDPAYPLQLGDVRVIGKGDPAPPQQVEIETLMNYENTDDWVSVEGHVVLWMLQGDSTRYVIDGPHRSFFLIVSDTTEFRSDLYGAKVRFTGITRRSASGTSYYPPGPDFMEVLSPGRTDRFASPEHRAIDIATSKVPLGEPVKVKGVVVGQVDRTIYLRCQGTALCVKLCPSWGRPPGVPPAFIADGTPHPALKVEDEVEVVGTAIRAPDLINFAPYDLVNANVRVIGHREKLEPVSTTFARVAAGEHTADLVQVRGRLMTWQNAPLPGALWRSTLLLTADGTQLTAVHESSLASPFDTLKVDDDILINAVVNRAAPGSQRHLRVLSPSDAKSLGYSSDLLTRRFWGWTFSGTLLVLILSGWIVGLRRSNRIKTEAAATLETRVQERTAALEQAQAELSKALEHERELGDLKSRFVSMVSHEFRTPLGVTMSAIEILRRMDDQLGREHKQELHADILNSTKHMAGLMEQVLLLGRVEAGKLGFKPMPCDLATLLGKLVDECLSATHRKCPIRIECADDLDEAQADESLVRHIVNNLVANAAKYSPDNAEVLVTARREGCDAIIEVIDHGIGIPEKDLPHLYEAFHRASNVGDLPGTGLGLVIVKRCADLHNGRISVHSVVGEGTRFTVQIPMFDSPNQNSEL